MTTPSTESPRNSSRSLVGRPPFSYANERCVRARSSSPASRSSTPRAAHSSSRDGRSASTDPSTVRRRPTSEDLTTVSARAVLSALGARAVRQVLGADRPGWRTSRARGQQPSTANGGGACCCATSSASGQPRLLLVFAGRGADRLRLSALLWSGRRARPIVGRRSPRARARDGPAAAPRTRGTVLHSPVGTRVGTAARAPPQSRSTGSRSNSSPSSRLASSSSASLSG